MTEPQAGTPATPPPFDLGPGLLEYYSSQAELMLAQYENINRLLGPTHDWTHPGDFCEILFREFLRRFLPPNLSADKGFFYGRTTLEGEDTHCPEIDILVHDTRQYRPLFRMGDFVVVPPQAVRGLIQVKRTLSDGQVGKGLKNVVCAKQHLLNVLWKDNPKGWSSGVLPPRIFTAVVGFKDEIGNNIDFYHKRLLESNVAQRAYDRPGMERTSMYVLPSFIGSLSGAFVTTDGPCNFWNQRYFFLNSDHNGVNIYIQAFLALIYYVLGGEHGDMPPFAFPHDLTPIGEFHVLRITKSVRNSDDSVTLHRNDEWRGHYRRSDATASDVIHLVSTGASSFTVTDRLKTDIAPDELFIEESSGVVRYELLKWEPPTSAPT